MRRRLEKHKQQKELEAKEKAKLNLNKKKTKTFEKKINEDDFYFLNMNNKDYQKKDNFRDLSYMKKSDAPPVGNYRPKYSQVRV